MSDRIAVMNHGVVEQLDAPEEVYERPADDLRGGLHRRLEPDAGDGRVRQRHGRELRLDSGARVRADGAGGLSAGERCYAVVRPEKLRIERARRAAGRDGPSVEGIVESSLYLGTATQFVVRLAGRRGDDGAGAQRRRGRAPAPARRGRARPARAGPASTRTSSARPRDGARARRRQGRLENGGSRRASPDNRGDAEVTELGFRTFDRGAAGERPDPPAAVEAGRARAPSA